MFDIIINMCYGEETRYNAYSQQIMYYHNDYVGTVIIVMNIKILLNK